MNINNKTPSIEQIEPENLTSASNAYELLGVLTLEHSARWAEFIIRWVNDTTLTIQAPGIDRFGIKYFGAVGDVLMYLAENFSLPCNTGGVQQ